MTKTRSKLIHNLIWSIPALVITVPFICVALILIILGELGEKAFKFIPGHLPQLRR